MPSTRFFAAVSVGERLPGLEIPITSTLIVGGALASRDFTPVHHDRAAAQPRLEDALAAHVHVVGVDQGEHGVGPLAER